MVPSKKINKNHPHVGLYMRQCCECMRIIEARIRKIEKEDDSECVSHGYCPSCHELFLDRHKNRKILKGFEALECKYKDLERQFEDLVTKITKGKKSLIILKE